MPTVLDAQVLTRRAATVHEDIGEQFDRLTGELWNEYAEKRRMSRQSSDEQQLAVTHPDEAREFRIFHERLHTWREVFLAIATRATSETSTLVSFLQTVHHAAAPRFEKGQPAYETEWTDEKNRRRCELVDKEIEETLSPEEEVELEKLQAEMLAYRRKVAPLPLDKLRELHQELLREAGDQE